MNKPDEIPQDVWDAADQVLSTTPNNWDSRKLGIARAILAERTKCTNQVFHVAKHVKATT